ncbi:MAG: flavin oxidoreductase [Gammaproteobacteria bacterium]|jgi:hypothetical protein|nr:flavin oxidoreductase [Gammaproteobacteria bacterium]
MKPRNIAIVGAGQAGLQLAIHLLSQEKYHVSLYTDRTADQVRSGRILSSQGMFNTALQVERLLSLNLWDDQCPVNTTVTFSLVAPDSNNIAIYWQGQVQPYQSIDQRMKFSRWMEIFENRGGHLVVEEVDLSKLNAIAQHHELTIVATGKGQIGEAFSRDDTRSRFTTPQRILTCLYVKNMKPMRDSFGVRGNIIPGVGEYFTMPGLTHNGHCQMMLFEGLPTREFDCWDKISSPAEQLQQAKLLLTKFLPWEAECCHDIVLTDENATLKGAYTPIIKYPTFTLPCGKSVLGLGDAIVLNDPIAGQGANHACKSAYIYGKRIINQEDKPFDETWMKETAEIAWTQHGKGSTDLSELLLMPPPASAIEVFQAASKNPLLANKLAALFDVPSDLSWLVDPEQASAFIKENENKNEADHYKIKSEKSMETRSTTFSENVERVVTYPDHSNNRG